MKQYKKFIFIDFPSKVAINWDISDGYLTNIAGERIKLPHHNYTLLGIADECINAHYAEEFSQEIVSKNESGLYLDYDFNEYHYESASDSFQTLAGKLDLNTTDYILRDDK